MPSEISLHETTRLFAPVHLQVERGERVLLIDPEAPHWIVTDRRGARIVANVDGKRTFGGIISDYCRAEQVDWAKGWLHCHTFLNNLLRTRFLSITPLVRAPEPDRSQTLQIEQMVDRLFSIVEERAKRKTPSGYDRPILFAATGEEAAGKEDASSHRMVRDFYGEAAQSPQPQLCCPGGYPQEEMSHIPKEVLEIAYGCGSPVGLAGIAPGETMIDLGSGGGIDCFIAVKKVGPKGRVIGIDMTDAMLEKARQAKTKVAARLGYDVVEFRKGYLEEIPLPDRFADVVTSNCVINLSPDKKQVFIEIWRVLKDFGRIVLSDTVSERPLPPGMKANPRLWGECVSGALTEAEYLSRLEEAGFYGLAVIKKSFWKEVEGYRFYSVVLRGFKYEKKRGCDFIGQRAIYLGPMQAVIDEEGHLFPRNQPVEVCTDTAAKLKRPPYAGSFIILEGRETDPSVSPSVSTENEACCPPGACR